MGCSNRRRTLDKHSRWLRKVSPVIILGLFDRYCPTLSTTVRFVTRAANIPESMKPLSVPISGMRFKTNCGNTSRNSAKLPAISMKLQPLEPVSSIRSKDFCLVSTGRPSPPPILTRVRKPQMAQKPANATATMFHSRRSAKVTVLRRSRPSAPRRWRTLCAGY